MFTWLNGTATSPPIFLSLRSSKWFIVLTISLATFTDIFLYGLIVPVLPFALTSRAGIPESEVQTWISILLAVYGGALLVASPFAGWYADRSESRKVSLLVGLVLLAGSTVFLTVGNSIGVFIAGRILQGFSAAVVWVVGLALLSDTVGTQELGEHMGYVAIALSMAILLAPLLGGVVYDEGGYYDVFAMAYGLLALDIVMRLALIEKKVALTWLPRDQVFPKSKPSKDEAKSSGDKESVADEAAQSEPAPTDKEAKDIADRACAQPPEEHLSLPPPTTEVTTPAKKTWETRLPPIISLLSSRRLDAALFGCFVQASLLTSFDSTLPIYVSQLFNYTSIGAGLVFLPLTIPSFLGPIFGWFSDKYGTRYISTLGFLLAVPPLILLRLVDHDSLRQKVLLCALLALIGVTLDMILVPMMAEITYAVEAKAAKRPKGYFGKGGAYAQAYGLFNMSFAAGSMAGPLLAGLIKAHKGWGTTTLVLGCLSAASAVPTFLWGGGSVFKERRARKARQECEREDDVGV